MSVIRVVKIVERKTVYYTQASDNIAARDAVHWRDSSGRETVDCVREQDEEVNTSYEFSQEGAELSCECGHFYRQHTDGGCGWASCSCRKKSR